MDVFYFMSDCGNFEITGFEPVPGIDPYAYELERKGKSAYVPYFTTIEKFQKA